MDEHEPVEQSEQDASAHSASAQVPLEKKPEAIEQTTPVADVDSTRDQSPDVDSSREQAPDVDSSPEQVPDVISSREHASEDDSSPEQAEASAIDASVQEVQAQDTSAQNASEQDTSVQEPLDDKVEANEQELASGVDSSREQAIAEVNILPVEPEKIEEIVVVDESQIFPGTSERAVEPEMVVLEVTEQAVEIDAVEEVAAPKPRASSVLSSGRRSSQLAQGELPPEASSEPAWYVIHCYSGYENKVRHNLEQRIETMGMKDRIFDVVIPTQEEIEVREGKRRTVERHIFPGYVLVNMTLSEESWYVVRNTPGVTGFVGMGNLPTALRPEEVSSIVKRMEADAPTVKVSFKEGERVRIIDGPFNDFRGTVAEIDVERTKVRVMVSFFGRETPVELDFLQVEKA